MPDSDIPLCSRIPNPDRQYVEVRPLVPVPVANVIDAACAVDTNATGRKKSREAKVIEILSEWAAREHHKATVIVRVCGINPISSDSES